MRVESIQTGQPRTSSSSSATDPLDRLWTSAIWKEPVQGRVWAGREGLSGDAQVWKAGHGGPERALLLYSAAHYPLWRAEWGTKDLGPGGFGENLTVSGLDETAVCVGDVFQLGAVRLEVSGPRGPCNNLVRRHRRPGLIERVNETGRAGWYARVHQEGWLEAGIGLVLLDRPYPQWTIARASVVKRHAKEDPTEAALLAACPALLADWRRKLAQPAGPIELAPSGERL
jgi:MOSC domain-containing protein YiiM